MRRWILWLLGAAMAGQVSAAERVFDFSAFPIGKPPPGFASIVAGDGAAGGWQVFDDPSFPDAGSKTIVRQVGADMTDEHYPMLVLGDDVYDDFTFTTRFKTANGVTEQMAGIAFRIQDAKNFYVFRVSALGRNAAFYKVVNGVRGTPVRVEADIAKNSWHELSVTCKANDIQCIVDGKPVLPLATDNTFGKGKIALWTKSDSESYFGGTRITYTPHETFIQSLAQDILHKHQQVLAIKVYGMNGTPAALRVIASGDPKDVGTDAGKSEQDSFRKDVMEFGRDSGAQSVLVTIPMHDRNGDCVAAVKLNMKSFPGQTEENAIVRAMPIVKEMEKRSATVKNLTD